MSSKSCRIAWRLPSPSMAMPNGNTSGVAARIWQREAAAYTTLVCDDRSLFSPRSQINHETLPCGNSSRPCPLGVRERTCPYQPVLRI